MNYMVGEIYNISYGTSSKMGTVVAISSNAIVVKFTTQELFLFHMDKNGIYHDDKKIFVTKRDSFSYKISIAISKNDKELAEQMIEKVSIKKSNVDVLEIFSNRDNAYKNDNLLGKECVLQIKTGTVKATYVSKSDCTDGIRYNFKSNNHDFTLFRKNSMRKGMILKGPHTILEKIDGVPVDNMRILYGATSGHESDAFSYFNYNRLGNTRKPKNNDTNENTKTHNDTSNTEEESYVDNFVEDIKNNILIRSDNELCGPENITIEMVMDENGKRVLKYIINI